jgi:putative thioredoxin
LAELLAARRQDGDLDEALALLERIPETAETRRVAALARTGAGLGADGGGNGSSADAGAEIAAKLEGLLDQVKSDADARQEFLDLLEVLGPDDPRTADYRKRLTRQLF